MPSTSPISLAVRERLRDHRAAFARRAAAAIEAHGLGTATGEVVAAVVARCLAVPGLRSPVKDTGSKYPGEPCSVLSGPVQ
jgi:hypothetical protein